MPTHRMWHRKGRSKGQPQQSLISSGGRQSVMRVCTHIFVCACEVYSCAHIYVLARSQHQMSFLITLNFLFNLFFASLIHVFTVS